MNIDLHLHTIASGHATNATITDMTKAAAGKGLQLIGISDHGPATTGSAKSSYFRSLGSGIRKRCGIDILYGVELNILDYDGTVDLEDEILMELDYAIISLHLANILPGNIQENTSAYINAMKHPKVKIIGHCDDVKYPVDYKALLKAAINHNVFFEINNTSLNPDGYRGNTRNNNILILNLCKEYDYPVLLSSDSHGTEHIGDFECVICLLENLHFPDRLILNNSIKIFREC